MADTNAEMRKRLEAQEMKSREAARKKQAAANQANATQKQTQPPAPQPTPAVPQLKDNFIHRFGKFATEFAADVSEAVTAKKEGVHKTPEQKLLKALKKDDTSQYADLMRENPTFVSRNIELTLHKHSSTRKKTLQLPLLHWLAYFGAVKWLAALKDNQCFDDNFLNALATDAAHYTNTTALTVAAAANKPKMVRDLIKAGADVNKRGEDAPTALIAAVKGNHIEVIQVLKTIPPAGDPLNPNLMCQGKAAIHWVFDQQAQQARQILVQALLDVPDILLNLTTEAVGVTQANYFALYFAYTKNDLGIVKLLAADSRVDLDQTFFPEITIRDMAERAQNPQMLAIFTSPAVRWKQAAHCLTTGFAPPWDKPQVIAAACAYFEDPETDKTVFITYLEKNAKQDVMHAFIDAEVKRIFRDETMPDTVQAALLEALSAHPAFSSALKHLVKVAIDHSDTQTIRLTEAQANPAPTDWPVLPLQKLLPSLERYIDLSKPDEVFNIHPQLASGGVTPARPLHYAIHAGQEQAVTYLLNEAKLPSLYVMCVFYGCTREVYDEPSVAFNPGSHIYERLKQLFRSEDILDRAIETLVAELEQNQTTPQKTLLKLSAFLWAVFKNNAGGLAQDQDQASRQLLRQLQQRIPDQHRAAVCDKLAIDVLTYSGYVSPALVGKLYKMAPHGLAQNHFNEFMTTHKREDSAPIAVMRLMSIKNLSPVEKIKLKKEDKEFFVSALSSISSKVKESRKDKLREQYQIFLQDLKTVSGDDKAHKHYTATLKGERPLGLLFNTHMGRGGKKQTDTHRDLKEFGENLFPDKPKEALEIDFPKAKQTFSMN